MCVQSMSDASPAKWHLAHTSWFFDRFVLNETRWDRLFNSYYETIRQSHSGRSLERPRRGVLSRPSVDEILAHRREVTERVLQAGLQGFAPETLRALELGLHHEEQHQELLLTDIQHAFFSNPLNPSYGAWLPEASQGDEYAPASLIPGPQPPLSWKSIDPGVYEVGAQEGESAFAYDHEGPQHRVFAEGFEIANRSVTNAEFLEFLQEGGYNSPLLWLAEGWSIRMTHAWEAPLYWNPVRDDATSIDGWQQFTLQGWKPLVPQEPVSSLSYFEADAYARWRGARLPSEFEWEIAFTQGQPQWPRVWEWTQSAYSPYPGFKPETGALGEYNGKFMINQMVLRGGSWATPYAQRRPSFRNFFPPHARWQFSGLRLARTLV